MTGPHRRRDPANCPSALGSIALGLAATLALAACGQTVTPTPIAATPSPIASEPSSPDTSSPSGQPSGTPLAGQTDTDWGRIWDDLPAGFPVYPGATPADESETGPVSATFAVEGVEAKTIAAWMQTELERATYSTEALTGPFEDGGFVLDSIGRAGCRVEVAAAPLGSLTTISVRYGAACPSP